MRLPFGITFTPAPPPPPKPKIKMAAKAPKPALTRRGVSANGHKALLPSIGDEDEARKPEKRDLAEWVAYQFGDEVPLERITRISAEDIIHFLAMKLQTRISNLTGEDDVDLQESMIEDYMGMMISEDGEGRREMNEIISAGIRAQQRDETEGELYGRLH